MALPTPDSLKNMTYIYKGQPFIDVPAKSSITLHNLQYIYLGQPFMRNEFSGWVYKIYGVSPSAIYGVAKASIVKVFNV